MDYCLVYNTNKTRFFLIECTKEEIESIVQQVCPNLVDGFIYPISAFNKNYAEVLGIAKFPKESEKNCYVEQDGKIYETLFLKDQKEKFGKYLSIPCAIVKNLISEEEFLAWWAVERVRLLSEK